MEDSSLDEPQNSSMYGSRSKVKIFSLRLNNEALYHENLWWMNVYIHVFLTSTLAGGKWSASRPGRFTPGEIAPTEYEAGWTAEPVWMIREIVNT
jgi:hypothetical protein